LKLLAAPLLLALVACQSVDPTGEVALQWGTFGLADAEQLFQVGVEYRAEPLVLGISPIVGASVLDDGGTYVHAGGRYDLDLGDRWQISPSFAPGIYSGESFDLGGPIEFRSGIDLSYRLRERWKVAVGVYHLSNGGLYSRNGGSEALLFSLVRVL